MARRIDAERQSAHTPRADWIELCTYIDGKHEETDLTAAQYAAVRWVLGLDDEEPYSDELLIAMLAESER
jgi:hypothetical protein